MQTLRSYELAVQFYKTATQIELPYYLKNQLQRAASSVALNLAEGSAKPTPRDRAKFYRIALGSFRECEAVIRLADLSTPTLNEETDKLGRHLYRLCKALE